MVDSLVTTVMRPKFMMTLSKPLVELLVKLSSIHYDPRCRSAGQIGGFLYGWRNHFVEFDLSTPVEADSHSLDTLLKIMECHQGITTADFEAKLGALDEQIRSQLRSSGVWLS